MNKKLKITKVSFRPALFWDTDPAHIDKKKHARYIIERVLHHGNDDEVKWVWSFYPKKTIKQVVEGSRSLDKRSRALWTLLLKEK